MRQFALQGVFNKDLAQIFEQVFNLARRCAFREKLLEQCRRKSQDSCLGRGLGISFVRHRVFLFFSPQ